MNNNYERVGCAEHGSRFLVEDYRAGDLVCTQCGLVVHARCIDVSQEWRTFSEDTVRVADSFFFQFLVCVFLNHFELF